MAKHTTTADLLKANAAGLLADWQAELSSAGVDSRITDSELRVQTHDLLRAIAAAAAQTTDVNDAAWRPVHELLDGVSRSRAIQGFSSMETASFVFTLKRPLFARLRRELAQRPDGAGRRDVGR